MVAPAVTTVDAMRSKVRRLTMSPDSSQLTDTIIDQQINTFITQDFPYAIKTDALRIIYTFYTDPQIDEYPIDIQLYQGIRDPVYFEGREGSLYKDQREFYRVWPKIATKNTESAITGSINSIDISLAPTVTVVITGTGLQTGDKVTFDSVGGTTELNGGIYTISNVTNPTATTTSFEVTQAAPSAYTSGGSISSNRLAFTITPHFIKNRCTIGALTAAGDYEELVDSWTSGSSGDIKNPALTVDHGDVNYETGAFSFTFDNPVAVGESATVWVCLYQPGRPFNLLYWKDKLYVRPIPDDVYKVEFECYKVPDQFTVSTASPIIQQWWQYIAYGAALKILQERNDMETVANIMPEFLRQEALVLERQGVEEIGVRNGTLFTYASNNQYGGYGGWY